MASEEKSHEPEPGATPPNIDTSPPEPQPQPQPPQPGALNEEPAPAANKPVKPKEEKKKYPQVRKQLYTEYGLSIRDHFIRDCYNKYQSDQIDGDKLFYEAINQTLTSIAEPYLPPKFTQKHKKLAHKSLLQVFSIRDIAKSQQKQDQLNTGKDPKRMLHFILTDGKTKINAVEYQHIVLLDNIGIYPGTKLQLENVTIRDGILLLRPSNVLWVGGDVASFTAKYLAMIKSREGDTRVHQKNLLKGETPPPQFEGNDLTAIDKKYEAKYEHEQEQEYDDYDYQDERVYSDQYNQVKYGHGQAQAQRQYNNNNNNYGQQNNKYQAKNAQKHVQQNNVNVVMDVPSNPLQNNHVPQQKKVVVSPSNEVKNEVKNNNYMPRTLMELYGVKQLPFTANIVAEIISATLQFNNQSHDAFIEFDVSDTTGKCKGMTSTHLMQWICSKYGNQINQVMVNAFFKQWGNRYINIKMELKDPQRMVIFHEIKWQ